MKERNTTDRQSYIKRKHDRHWIIQHYKENSDTHCNKTQNRAEKKQAQGEEVAAGGGERKGIEGNVVGMAGIVGRFGSDVAGRGGSTAPLGMFMEGKLGSGGSGGSVGSVGRGMFGRVGIGGKGGIGTVGTVGVCRR
ncbi:peroxidase-like protein 2 [Momordica charantia]|uniref:Peroxidase-like protein 2 n=1 Tax=Momordica charantia TaxID=3673 RepID=A0A6J1D738_MOMCH|nr:peroxidase-like protein 2 [Momordica charantia]